MFFPSSTLILLQLNQLDILILTSGQQKWGRAWIRLWTHKIHPIAHLTGWEMGCILWVKTVLMEPPCILWTILMTFYTHLHINFISRAIISHLRYQIWLSLSLFVFYGICQLSVLIPMFSLVATLMAVAGLSLDGSLYVFGISRLLREQTSASIAETHHPTENHDLPHTISIIFTFWSL